MINNKVSLVFGLTLLLFSCSQKPSGNPEFIKQNSQVEDLEQKRNDYNKKIAEMNIPELIAEMENDSKRGREPFNSPSYKEIIAKGRAVAPEVRAAMQEKGPSSLFTLLALKNLDEQEYMLVDPSFRIDVLIGSLQNSKTFNIWGIPHLYWEDPAKSIIAEGQNAVKPLIGLLNDKRPAPVWGSQEVVEYEAYNYRVCDYAWAMLLAIQDRKLDQIPQDPAERDRLMRQVDDQEDK